MAWSHLHPALIHFVVGLGVLLLFWDIKRLGKPTPTSENSVSASRMLEGWVALLLLGVGTGWIALVHDTILQHGGKPILLGEVHGKMAVLLLGFSTARALGGPDPKSKGLRRLFTGIDWGVLGLLLATALLGEWLVFRGGLGLSGVTF